MFGRRPEERIWVAATTDHEHLVISESLPWTDAFS